MLTRTIIHSTPTQSCIMAAEARALRLVSRIHHDKHRPSSILNRQQRLYATQSTSSRPTRRAITVTSDDGRYHWSELSTGEKAARSTQQSFNFLFATAGAVGTVCADSSMETFANNSRSASPTCYTPNSLQPIPRPVNSIVPLNVSRMIQNVVRY